MNKTRLEAFSDGVMAIIITVMILELHVPSGEGFEALRPVLPSFLSYTLSFVFIGIYWNNHHHMLHMATHVTGGILWANLHLLFWLSLVPFVTSWLGQSHLSTPAAAVYGSVLFFSGIAYTILERLIIASQGPGSKLKAAVGNDRKGLASASLYALAVGMAFVDPRLSAVIYVLVAVMWLVPDRRIESKIARPPG